MDIPFDHNRLLAAYERARGDLLAERGHDGHWTGELSASALSTATAVSALAIVERRDATTETGHFVSEARESFLSELIVDGINWLADHQNADGGWGDTDKSHSNIATTILVVAAFHLTGVPSDHADALERAQKYISEKGGVRGLRARYGKDKTFAVPILTNCALAGLVPWSKVAPLPFELACFPQSWYRFLRLPVVSYAIPALVAIGQCRYYHQPPWNPVVRAIRARCVEPSLEVLRNMQPASGGYLEAIPLTSFVVMSLASMGRVRHPVTQAGLEFIVESVREDGSWPIDTDLATWNTTLAVCALAKGAADDGRQRSAAEPAEKRAADAAVQAPRAKTPKSPEKKCLEWILSCQHLEPHPFTGAQPGGWGWSDLSGAVPDADDTPGALLALAHFAQSPACSTRTRVRIATSARRGVRWLLELQNADGGWPTFCRGWGKLPFDRSGADLTAHAIRAILAWEAELDGEPYQSAIDRGVQYLLAQQRPDGAWIPLWFGNQDDPREENPVYGTAKVLLAVAALCKTSPLATNRSPEPALCRGVEWLVDHQNPDGGWGGEILPPLPRQKRRVRSSVEETALAVEALLAAGGGHVNADGLTFSGDESDERMRRATARGLDWLTQAVEENRHREASPIGFYFAKLWYYEKLYPMIFTVSALGQAVGSFAPPAQRKPIHAHR